MIVQTVKNLPAMQETWVPSVGREDPLEEDVATHSSTLLCHEQRSLAGYSPWDLKESDTAEQLKLPFTVSSKACTIS